MKIKLPQVPRYGDYLTVSEVGRISIRPKVIAESAGFKRQVKAIRENQ